MRNLIQLFLVAGVVTFIAAAMAATSARVNSNSPTNSVPVANSATSIETSSPTPTGGLPMRLPPQVDPNSTTTLDETQRQSSNAFQNLEVCRDDDAACIRRRNEQMRRNTPFQQQTPPAPGVNNLIDNSNSNIRQ